MKVYVACLGTTGDLNPYLSVAAELAARNHDVVILSDATKRARVHDAGLGFAEVMSGSSWEQFLAHPGLWDRDASMMVLYQRLFLPTMIPTWEAVLKGFQPGNTLLIGNTGAIGLKLAQEKLGLPLVHLYLTPYQLRAETRASTAEEESELRNFIDQFRRTIRLPGIAGPLLDWFYSSDLALTAYPAWFDVTGQGTRPQLQFGNFIFRDGARAATAGWKEFLARGEKPLVFTAGTGMRRGEDFFEAALAACTRLRSRAVFLTSYPEQLPAGLPDTVLVSNYIPLGELLPDAGGIVHHGGIGTCAQALRAGIPQLVMPMAFDQFDNADSLARLGAGSTISRSRIGTPELDDKLSMLLNDGQIAARARALSERLAGVDGTTVIADVIERGPLRRIAAA